MRDVSARRVATFALMIILTAPGVFAATRERDQGWADRLKQVIVRILDDFRLSGPPG